MAWSTRLTLWRLLSMSLVEVSLASNAAKPSPSRASSVTRDAQASSPMASIWPVCGVSGTRVAVVRQCVRRVSSSGYRMYRHALRAADVRCASLRILRARRHADVVWCRDTGRAARALLLALQGGKPTVAFDVQL